MKQQTDGKTRRSRPKSSLLFTYRIVQCWPKSVPHRIRTISRNYMRALLSRQDDRSVVAAWNAPQTSCRPPCRTGSRFSMRVFRAYLLHTPCVSTCIQGLFGTSCCFCRTCEKSASRILQITTGFFKLNDEVRAVLVSRCSMPRP